MYAAPVAGEARLVERADIETLSRVLADAFVDDPLSQWLFGDDGRLGDRLYASFRVIIRRVYIKKGHAYTTKDIAGGALWAPPGKWKLSVVQQLWLAPTYVRIVPPARLRGGARLNVLLERAHPRDPHWHLSVLGVDPKRQRTGVGGALIRPVLERADADRVLCYLETSKEENIPYYARHGFEVTTELDMPPGAPRLWTMTRRPL
jgi:ribosomal protein S18 acetylase RimI-like enzyme